MSLSKGAFNYLAPISRLVPPEQPFRYAYAPPKGRPLHNEVLDRHVLPLHDARLHRDAIGLDSSGFGLLTGVPTQFDSWHDNSSIVDQYYPEMINLLRSKLGAQRVHIFDHTIRRRAPDFDTVEDKPGQRQPVFRGPADPRVHVDQTPKAGEQRVHSLLGPTAGQEALKKRVQLINMWRPLRGPVQDAPLAMIDTRSIDWAKDMVVAKILYRDRTGFTYLVHHNPNHKWYYVPEMMPSEIILLKCYDNMLPNAIAAHSGFCVDNPPQGFLPRQSIELRALVFYDE